MKYEVFTNSLKIKFIVSKPILKKTALTLITILFLPLMIKWRKKNILWLFLAIGMITSSGRASAQANQPGAGNCLQFNGVNNIIQVADANNLSFTNTLTIEAWINTAQNGIAKRIIGKELIGSIWPEYFVLMNNDGTIQFGINTFNGDNISRLNTVASYNDNLWHHVAATYDGATMRIFIDGIPDGTLATTKILWNSSSQLSIGSANGGVNATYTWDGQLDEVRIWNRALTQTEIRNNMCQKLIGNEPGLVGYWRFDETAGNIYFDSQTNVAPNNGTGF